jgi:hypothetical protein
LIIQSGDNCLRFLFLIIKYEIFLKLSLLLALNIFLSSFENGAAAHTAKADFVLAVPNLHAVAQQERNLPQELAVFDTNGDGIIDENEERICMTALDTYCHSKNVDKSKMVDLLRRYSFKSISPLRPASPPIPMFRSAVPEEPQPQFRAAPTEHHIAIPVQRQNIQQSSAMGFTSVLLQAMTDALKQYDLQNANLEKNNVYKKKSFSATGFTVVLATTMLVHYLSPKDC